MMDFNWIASISDGIAANWLDERLQKLDDVYKRGFAERGLILMEMERRSLWALLMDSATQQPYTSMDRWIMAAAPWSYRSCYEAKECLKRISVDVPANKLADIPRGNLMLMVGMSSQVRANAGVLEAARTMKEDAFTAKIEAEYPSEHIESRRTMQFRPSRSQAEVIQTAINEAIMLGKASTREEVLEMWAAEWSIEHAKEIAEIRIPQA